MMMTTYVSCHGGIGVDVGGGGVGSVGVFFLSPVSWRNGETSAILPVQPLVANESRRETH